MKAPLLVLALALTAAAPASEQRIDVALSNFKFTPSTIALVHGQRYVLHLTSSGGHSFAARDFFAAAAMPAADRAKIRDGKVELDSDTAVDLHFTAPGAGTHPIKCTHLLHASFGMTGKFVVN
ncbi:putative cupredoxin-like copper-binding protein [Sphingomonas leidyi]|uniref:Putative cupredoxin-like copper-binding protein n=1 Tax=Sphingomonas leidyi TaxID=68569 RepID=A0A7X5UW87_9SPHN|nr:copper-binding protein [Sphingomonas leidyi]NIJ63308.1 putative cupredoxin-like copper-binding protein [Sphingomonas leidyi]